jgi:type II secretory pathway component GspD/PulD (secretin)
MLHAYLLYARAAALEPSNVTYAARKVAVQGMAEITSPAKLDRDPAVEARLKQSIPLPNLTGDDLLDSREALAPPSLVGSAEKRSFNLKGDARSTIEKVAEAYGLMVAFEGDYQTPPPFTFRVEDMGFQDAMRALEMVSSSFFVPVHEHLAMVVRDTPQKRTQFTPAMSISIPFPEHLSVQESQEIVTAVQTALDIRRIRTDGLHKMVIIRDQVAKVQAARAMFASLSRLAPQIELEVEFISIDKSSTTGYGFSLPNSFPLVDFGRVAHASASIPSAFTNFLAFGGGATFLGLGISEASAMATLSKSSVVSLLKSQIVTVDGMPGSLHVGNRYPLISASYSGVGTSAGTGTTTPLAPTVNYTDLGLTLKVTPSVHEDGEVTLDLETQFSVLGAGSSISGIPIIASRKYNGKVRLRNGEWAVVAGLVQTTDSDTQNGIAGLANIPFLGKLLSQNSRERDSTEILLVLKPHLVTVPPWEYVSNPIWVGSENKPVSLFRTVQ